MTIHGLMAIYLLFTQFAFAANSTKPLIIIDPGHGGEDTGAIQVFKGEKIYEKNIAFDISKKLQGSLSRLGYEAVLTRNQDKFTDLDDRTKLAKNLIAKNPNRFALFVSLHLNSDKNKSSNGVEAYIFNATTNDASVKLAEIENGSKRVAQHGILNLIFADLSASANYEESLQLACSLTNRISSGGILKNRGVRQGLFYVLMDSQLPSVILELGFMSNPKELERLLNPTFQQTLASRIALTIQSEIHRQTSLRRNTLAMSGILKGQKRQNKPICKPQ